MSAISDRDSSIAYTLGVRVRRGLERPVDLSYVQIVTWGNARESVAEGLQRSLGSTRPRLHLVPQAVRYRHGQFSAIEPGQKIILLVDTLSDQGSIEGVVRALRRMGANLLLIACVRDYRSNSRHYVTSFAGPVRVISFDANDLLRSIDTFTQDAVLGEAETSLAWMSQFVEPTVYIGHIDRGPQRHFTTYLNLGQMLTSRDEVAHRCARELETAIPTGTRHVRIVFPHDDDGYAGELATNIAGHLDLPRGANVVLTPAKRSRTEAGFESEGPWESETFAVVLDWGAVTTATLRDLAALCARAGADAIHIMALTSQLDHASELSLSRVASIRERRTEHSASLFEDGPGGLGQPRLSELRTVPTATTIIMRLPMGMWSAAECEICWMAQQFREHRISAPSRLLREHAARKFELYRPRTRGETLGGRPTDLLGIALTGPESLQIYSAMLMFRRANVANDEKELLGLLMSSATRKLHPEMQAWIRLLTVEPHWLHTQPLEREELRFRLSTILIEILLGATTPVASSTLRWQAAIVLRATSKGQLVDRFGDLVIRNIADANIVGELFYGLFTMLERPYNRTTAVTNRALTALQDTRDRILELRRLDSVNDEILFTTNVLYRRTLELARSLEQPDSAMLAWHSLQQAYVLPLKTHAGVLTDMLSVVNAFSPYSMDLDSTLDSAHAYWAEILELWESCSSFLTGAVFPYLPYLRDVLEGYVSTTTAWGVELLAFDSARAEEFANALAAIAHNPASLSEPVRVELEIEARNWCQALLLAPDPSSHGALLVHVLDENPSDLRRAWESALTKISTTGLRYGEVQGDLPSGAHVFCRFQLLLDTFAQVLLNAAGSANALPGRPDDGPAFAVSAENRDGIWSIIIVNNWSAARTGGESGLASFRQALAAFGGELAHGPLRSEASTTASGKEWTYEVRIRLLAWPS